MQQQKKTIESQDDVKKGRMPVSFWRSLGIGIICAVGAVGTVGAVGAVGAATTGILGATLVVALVISAVILGVIALGALGAALQQYFKKPKSSDTLEVTTTPVQEAVSEVVGAVFTKVAADVEERAQAQARAQASDLTGGLEKRAVTEVEERAQAKAQDSALTTGDLEKTSALPTAEAEAIAEEMARVIVANAVAGVAEREQARAQDSALTGGLEKTDESEVIQSEVIQDQLQDLLDRIKVTEEDVTLDLAQKEDEYKGFAGEYDEIQDRLLKGLGGHEESPGSRIEQLCDMIEGKLNLGKNNLSSSAGPRASGGRM